MQHYERLVPRAKDRLVLVMDGATYHTGALTKQVLHAMKVRYLILAPFSTDGAAVERIFSIAKRGVLNLF